MQYEQTDLFPDATLHIAHLTELLREDINEERYLYKTFRCQKNLEDWYYKYLDEHPMEGLHVFRKLERWQQFNNTIWGEFGPGRQVTDTVYYLECGFQRYIRSEEDSTQFV